MTAWRMAFRAGNGGPEMWPECRRLGVAAITYPRVVDDIDLSQHPEGLPAEIRVKLSSTQQASLRRVAHEMKRGDVIYVKQGPCIVGKGTVTGSYRFDRERKIHDPYGNPWCHQVPVRWERAFPEVWVKLGSEPLTVKELSQADVDRIEAEARRATGSRSRFRRTDSAATMPNRWGWIYKCNSRQHPLQVAYGDWDDFYKNNRIAEWGSTEWVPALAQLNAGDSVIAYQTDRNELVGLAEVVRLKRRGAFQDLYLRPLEVVRRKVRPLKRADPRIAAIPALQPGPIKTIYDISEADAERLLRAAGAWFRRSKRRSTARSAANARLRNPAQRRRAQDGGGFGTPETNAAVEAAAINFVAKMYRQRGWSVRSVEREKWGYDLICRKGRTVREVEVKGSGGSREAFMVTSGEISQAKVSPRFILCLVRKALSENPKLSVYSGSQFLRGFTFEPTQFRATRDPSRS